MFHSETSILMLVKSPSEHLSWKCVLKNWVIQDFQLFIASPCCEFCWGLAREGGMATGGALVFPIFTYLRYGFSVVCTKMIRNDLKFHEESPGLNDMRWALGVGLGLLELQSCADEARPFSERWVLLSTETGWLGGCGPSDFSTPWVGSPSAYTKGFTLTSPAIAVGAEVHVGKLPSHGGTPSHHPEIFHRDFPWHQPASFGGSPMTMDPATGHPKRFFHRNRNWRQTSLWWKRTSGICWYLWDGVEPPPRVEQVAPTIVVQQSLGWVQQFFKSFPSCTMGLFIDGCEKQSNGDELFRNWIDGDPDPCLGISWDSSYLFHLWGIFKRWIVFFFK